MSVPMVLALILRLISLSVGAVYLVRAAWMWKAIVGTHRRGRLRMLSMALFMVTGAATTAAALAASTPATFLTPLVTAAMVTGLAAACARPDKPPQAPTGPLVTATPTPGD